MSANLACSVEMDKAEIIPESAFLVVVESVEAQSIEPVNLLKLARFSSLHGPASAEAIWLQDRAFGRLLDVCCTTLRREEEDNLSEPALILLMSLVTNQTNLLGGREGEVMSLLLELRRRDDKSISAAAQAVMQLFVSKMNTLYGLATMRSSLESHIAKYRGEDGKLDPATANSYSMALEGLGRLFLDLPSEVLEEEIIRARELLKTVRPCSNIFMMHAESAGQALNDSTYPHLRQASIAALAKANLVLQDDSRLFEIIGGLTKSQIHLCTYLFAREAASSA